MDVGDCQDMARSSKVLIDTNILVYMYENKKDIFEFVENIIPTTEFFVLDKSIEEIEKIYKEKPRKLELLKKYLEKLKNIKKIKILKT